MPAYLCTRDRLVRLRRDGADIVLEADRLQCVAAYDRTVLVGTLGGGGVLSRDEGATWERIALPEADVLSVAVSAAEGRGGTPIPLPEANLLPVPFSAAYGALYAGTEPSRLFFARDGGGWT